MSFVYLDTSVALAHLLVEDRVPSEKLWAEALISSRLLEFEIWNRIHARGLAKSHGEMARELIGRVALVELISPILDHAKEPFTNPVRTLDALHLSSLLFLRARTNGYPLRHLMRRCQRPRVHCGFRFTRDCRRVERICSNDCRSSWPMYSRYFARFNPVRSASFGDVAAGVAT